MLILQPTDEPKVSILGGMTMKKKKINGSH